MHGHRTAVPPDRPVIGVTQLRQSATSCGDSSPAALRSAGRGSGGPAFRGIFPLPSLWRAWTEMIPEVPDARGNSDRTVAAAAVVAAAPSAAGGGPWHPGLVADPAAPAGCQAAFA